MITTTSFIIVRIPAIRFPLSRNCDRPAQPSYFSIADRSIIKACLLYLNLSGTVSKKTGYQPFFCACFIASRDSSISYLFSLLEAHNADRSKFYCHSLYLPVNGFFVHRKRILNSSIQVSRRSSRQVCFKHFRVTSGDACCPYRRRLFYRRLLVKQNRELIFKNSWAKNHKK